MSALFFDEENLLSDDFEFVDGLAPFELQTQQEPQQFIAAMQSPQFTMKFEPQPIVYQAPIAQKQPKPVVVVVQNQQQINSSSALIELTCDNPSPYRKGDDAGEFCSYLDNRHPVFRFVWNGESNGIELGLKCVLSKTTQATYRDSRGPVPQNLECIIPIRQICTLTATEQTNAPSQNIPSASASSKPRGGVIAQQPQQQMQQQGGRKTLIQRWSFMPWREVKEKVTDELAKELPYILQKRNVNALRFDVVDIKTEKVLCDREILYRSSSSSAPSASQEEIHQHLLQQQQQHQHQVVSATASFDDTPSPTTQAAAAPQQQQVRPAPDQQQPPTKRRRTDSSASATAEVMIPNLVAPTLISTSQQQQQSQTTTVQSPIMEPNFAQRTYSYTMVDSPFTIGAAPNAQNQNIIFAQPQPIMVSPELYQQQHPQATYQFIPQQPTLIYEPARRNSVIVAPQGSNDDLAGMFRGMPVQLLNTPIDEVSQQDPVHDLIRICDRIAGGPRDRFQQVGPALCKVMGDLILQISKPQQPQSAQQQQQQQQPQQMQQQQQQQMQQQQQAIYQYMQA